MPDPQPTVTCTAIIVAAGSSQRMGFDKLAAQLSGMSVLRRTLDAFLKADCVSEIIVVCPEDRWESLATTDFAKPVLRVDGGTGRQSSVARGLAAVPASTAWIAVHDGARPLIDPDDIKRCLQAATHHRAATLARRVVETLKRSDAENFSTEAVPRENLWLMETPQIFATDLLTEAYANVLQQGLTITDEVSAIEALGIPVKFIESTHPNPKITTPADLALAEALLR